MSQQGVDLENSDFCTTKVQKRGSRHFVWSRTTSVDANALIRLRGIGMVAYGCLDLPKRHKPGVHTHSFSVIAPDA